VYLARTGMPKEGIREEISGRFGYDLDRTVTEIRPSYGFDVSCQGSVPEAFYGGVGDGEVDGGFAGDGGGVSVGAVAEMVISIADVRGVPRGGPVRESVYGS